MLETLKKLFQKLLNLLNLHPDDNQKWLLMSTLISGLLTTYSNPTLVKAIISEVPSEYLAFQNLVASTTGLLVGAMWKGKPRLIAIRNFMLLAITESVLGFIVGMYCCFVHWNVWLYALIVLAYSSVITTFIAKCVMTFKANMWTEKGREVYDNNASIVSGIVCIVGFSFAIIAAPSLKVALFLWGICCILDDIGWIIVYSKNKEKLKSIK